MSSFFQLEILQRLLQPDTPTLPPETAKYLLDIHLEEKDHARMEALGTKANRGTLTADEDEELRYYLLICDALNLLHAKARLSLIISCGTAPVLSGARPLAE